MISPMAVSASSLAGLRVLVTRARHQSGRLVDRLRELGAEPVELPLIEIVPLQDFSELDATLTRRHGIVIFTSANAVAAVLERLAHLGRRLGATRVTAVGPATAAALVARGVVVHHLPPAHTAEAIVSTFRDLRRRRILLPQADIADVTLVKRLRARGAVVDAVAAYRTMPSPVSRQDLRRILERGIDVVTFLSPSSVRTFRAIAGPESLKRALIACVGPATAATARELQFNVDIVAAEHTAAGLVDAMARHFEDRR